MKIFYEHDKNKNEGQRQQQEIAVMMLDKVRQMKDKGGVKKDTGNALTTGLYWLEMALNNSINEACAQLYLDAKLATKG